MLSGYLKFLLICASFLSLSVISSSASPSVHDLLPEYGLPKGLLPDAVKSYSLEEDGSFVIELERPCYVHFENLAYYEKKITGKISYGAITDISGIQAKKFFIWVSVTGMRIDPPDYVEFEVGPLSEKLSITQFQKIPTCKSKACSHMQEEKSVNTVAVAEA
ncbi:hypothetical protein EJ110_NYTH10977 [Nymphaea thermarum]|nr:hypothetical protein EJ110_NYTH10977 [Nymphaea thermarum]